MPLATGNPKLNVMIVVPPLACCLVPMVISSVCFLKKKLAFYERQYSCSYRSVEENGLVVRTDGLY